jgi:acyl-CoA synthetase (AMP-forming)/AMP-acid ligase II
MTAKNWRNFGDVLRQRALERPDAQAFAFLDRHGTVIEERSFAKLDARARTIAAALAGRGLAGKPVLLVYPSGLDFVDALFGCFYAGAIAVPAPYAMARRAGDRIGAILRDCQPDLVLTLSRLENDAEIRGAADNFSGELPFLYTDRLEAPASQQLPEVAAADIALLQYTSGSVAAPKGVMLSHGNLLANSAMIQEAFGHDGDLRMVSWLPLFHDMGLIGHILQPVYVGGISVLMSPMTFLTRPIRWLQAISDWRGTTSGAPNHAFDLCTRMISPDQAALLDLSSWQVAYCGSEMVRAETMEKFAGAFEKCGFRPEALFPCYGMAEATLMVTGVGVGRGMRTVSSASNTGRNEENRFDRRFVSCGPAWRDQRIVIVDPVTGTRLPDGEVGEVCLRGSNVAKGYWRRAEETELSFGARFGFDNAVYLRTGDLGFLEGGELFVVGRLKDIIIVRGVNHAPEDIEATVATSHDGFSGSVSAAFGVNLSDEEQVVVVQEVKRPADVELEVAIRAAFEGVTREHGLRLHDLIVVRQGAIPRTSSGKVRRGRCREMYQANEFDRLGVWTTLSAVRHRTVAGAD